MWSKINITLEDVPTHLQSVFAAEDQKSGVYVVLSRSTKRGYVGMSTNIMVRWLLHYQQMNEGQHNAAEVQKLFDSNGIDDFLFLVLEYVEMDHAALISTENRWKLKCSSSLLNNPHDCGKKRLPKPKDPQFQTATNISSKKKITRQIYIGGKMIEVPLSSSDWK